MKIRMQITKDAGIRFVSHLDYLRAIERSIRRAELPVAYSMGFNPHMKLSLASALSVGVVSYTEFMEIEMEKPIDIDIVIERLCVALPKGIRIIKADVVPFNEPSLMAKAAFTEYKVTLSGDGEKFINAVEKFNHKKCVMYKKIALKRKAGFKEVDIKRFVEHIKCKKDGNNIILQFEVKIFQDGSLKAMDVLNSLDVEYANADIERIAIYREGHLPMLNV